MGLKFPEDLHLWGFSFAIFFFFFFFSQSNLVPRALFPGLVVHNREKREIEDRQTRTLKENEKKFELSAIRLFFLGIAGNCTAIFIADTGSLSTDPTDPSGSGLVVALRARPRASRCFRKERTEKQDNVCVQGTSQRYVSCLK